MVTLRAVGVGLAFVVIISALVSYNDYTLGNTPLIGNYLPIGAMLLTFLFVVLVNAPLSRYRPGWAFSGGELCVLFSVTLVGCALPSTGLMRYLLPSFVMPQVVAAQNQEFGQVLRSLELPEWIYPSFASSDRTQWARDPIVTGFAGRWIEPGGYPYLAFVRPLATWGVFFGALAAALVSMVLVVHPQWAHNERLPFPLAQIQLALIEPPERGKAFNATLRERAFWLGFGAVFLLHIWNGLAIYTANRVPPIPLSFNLASIFSNPPFSYADGSFYKASLFVTAAAVTYFLRPQVGLSLWVFFLASQLVRMWLGTTTGDPTIRGQGDLGFGGFMAFVLMVLLTGRRHFLAVFRSALLFRHGGGRPPPGTVAARVLVVAAGVAIGWLCLAGCTLMGATALVLFMLVLFFGLTRIVAESGVLHAQFQTSITRPFTLLAQLGIGSGRPVPMETFYLAQKLQCVMYDPRETVSVYTSHALKLADSAEPTAPRRERTRFIVALALALLVAYPVSAFFHLRNEYTYAATLGASSSTPIDAWGAQFNWLWQLAPAVTNYARGPTPGATDPVPWFSAGFVMVTALYTARLYLPAFPLHPIGLLMLGSYGMTTLWFSFFIGHVSKSVVVRFGGYDLYNRTKPFAIGLILGECGATAAWLVTALVLSQLGLPFRAVPILPF